MQLVIVSADRARAVDELPAHLEPGEFAWCDCHYDEARDWVEPLAPLTGTPVFEDHLHDAENPHHPSHFDATSGYEVIVFRGLLSSEPLVDDAGTLRVRTRPTVFFTFARCVVTVRAPDSQLVPSMRARLLGSAGAASRLPGSPEAWMLRMLAAMVDRFLEQRQPLADRLERWQRQLLDPRRPFRDWMALLDARSELRRLELLCEGQLDALERWREHRLERSDADESALPELAEATLVRANDVVEHINRVISHARRLEHSIETAVQLHFSSTAHRTNEVMRTLTVITAVFMPLTLITGIFGMNFEFIPGLHSRVGFWIAIGSMATIAVALLAYFRARRYLSATASSRPPTKGRREGPSRRER